MAQGGAARHLLQRIEAHRAARRTAAALLDAPLVLDTSAVTDEGQDGVEPTSQDYAVPWPIDLCAGLPDVALFGRTPTAPTSCSAIIGASSQEHDPLDLLFLDSRGPLDMFATLHGLAARAAAYATRHAEHLHWKHRPKPVHVHLQMPVAERLAHALLCLLIAKQVGTVVSSEDDKVARKPTGTTAPGANAAATGTGAPAPTFTMEETRHDRFLSGLLTAVVYCRTLTTVQRAEVDRLLALLVFASMDLAWMRRAFPWLELDDNRMSVFAAGAGNHSERGESEGRTVGQRISATTADLHAAGDTLGRESLSLESSLPSQDVPDRETAGRLLRRSRADVGTKLLASAGRVGCGASLVLFQLQQIWIGWLATAGGEAAPPAAADVQDAAPGVGPPARLDAAAVHSAARRLLLGPRAAALCPALDLVPGNDGLGGLTQRRLWALTGHLPTGSRDAGPVRVVASSDSDRLSAGVLASDESGLDEDDPARRLVPPDPRARWRPMLEELASCEPHRWRLNPCSLDPVSWAYDPRALADPFRAFSWRLRGDDGFAKAADASPESCATASGWPSSPGCLLEVADPPLPPLRGQEPPAIEVIWEQTMAELKALSAIFNSLEAAESARTRRPPRASEEQTSLGSQESTSSTSSQIESLLSRSTLFVPALVANARADTLPTRGTKNRRTKKAGAKDRRPPLIKEQIALLRKRVEEEEDLEEFVAEEIPQRDIESELQAIKSRHHEEGLDVQLRDYVTLASVRKREADWWGRGGASAAAYKDALEAGQNATWNPAPAACAPIRLRIRASAGTPWQVVRAASFRGLTFDCIDSRGLLCSQVGLLGLCTWFDSVLKATPHAYIQTRQCEELFQERLRGIIEANSSSLVGGDVASGNNALPSTTAVQVPMRGPSQLGAAGAMWPHPSSGSMVPTAPPPRKPVLTASGVARWPRARNPLHPPASRLMYAGGERSPSAMLPLPPSDVPTSGSPRQATTSLLPGCRSPSGQRGRTPPGGRVASPWLSGRGSPGTPGPTGRSDMPGSHQGDSLGQSLEAKGSDTFGAAREHARILCKAVRGAIYRKLAKPKVQESRGKAAVGGPVQLDRTVPKAKAMPAATVLLKAPDVDGPAWKRRLANRMFPEPEPRPSPRRTRPMQEQRNHVFPPYTVESSLFEQLVHESVSTRVSASQMQYLLGVAVRAEPLWAEAALGRLGACTLPVRHDFFPWDSTLEAIKVTSAYWPCSPEQFDVFAEQPPPSLEGEKKRVLRRGYSVRKNIIDDLAMFGRFWPAPSDREKAQALGPRLLRIRRLGSHPSIGLVPHGRCANAAFCTQLVAALDATQGTTIEGPFKCSQCDCAWYCSATCQALHKSAHSFECQALRSLRLAANGFESRGLERTKRTLATLLEHVLAKQFSMVARPEDLVGCTALSEDLLSAIYGASHAVPPHQGTMTRKEEDSESDGSEGLSDRASIGTTVRRGSQISASVRSDLAMPSSAAKALQNTKLVEWTQMLIVPEDFAQWTVQLDAGNFEAFGGRRDSLEGRRVSAGAEIGIRSSLTAQGIRGSDNMRGTITAREPAAGQGTDDVSTRRVPGGLFNVRQSHAHTAAGVVRLLLRWVGATSRSSALREVIDDGFIFCLITGLCETRHFSKRRLTKHGVVSVLAHRMSLHVAASQQWRALAPSLAPPRQFQDGGLQGIECAQYSAYYAFLKPLRLPFARLRPLLPIICLVWGEAARNALMALPHIPETIQVSFTKKEQGKGMSQKDSLRYRSGSPSNQGIFQKSGNELGDFLTSSHQLPEVPGAEEERDRNFKSVTRPNRNGAQNLTRFLEVASEHLANIQLIDSVNLDVLTGKAVFLMYTSAVDTARAADASDSTCVLLLDAARGMQAVASPLPARELRRCAL